MIILADITGVYHCSELKFINALRFRIETLGVDRALIVLHERQKARIPTDFEMVVVNDWQTPGQIVPVVQERLFQLLKNTQNTVQVLSLLPAVLDLADKVPDFAKSRASSFHWFKIPPLGQPVAPRAREFSAPVGGWSEAAVVALLKMLAKFPGGLRKSSLREILVGVSQEFEKRLGGPSISSLVAVAKGRGMIELDSLTHVNPVIKLTPHGVSASSVSLGIGLPSSEAPPESKSEPVSALGSEGLTQPSAGECGELKNPQNAPSVVSEETGFSAGDAESPTRIQKLFALFKKADLGPFSSDRDEFYAEIERLVNLGKR